MIKKVKGEDVFVAFLEEARAFFLNKYQIKYNHPIYEDKFSWKITKPVFYFDMYPESKVDDTLWVMDVLWFNIRRRR
jgi:hypothetical protein